MTTTQPEIEILLQKVIREILKGKEFFGQKYFIDLTGKYKEPAYELEDAAGNHLFDDYPELFEITEQEGHSIRAYFQQSKGCRYNADLKKYINALVEKTVIIQDDKTSQ